MLLYVLQIIRYLYSVTEMILEKNKIFCGHKYLYFPYLHKLISKVIKLFSLLFYVINFSQLAYLIVHFLQVIF